MGMKQNFENPIEFKQQGIQLHFVVVLFVLFCFVCSMNLTLIIRIKLCKLGELSGDQNNTPKFQPLLLAGRSVSIVTQQKWVQMLLRLFFPLYPSPYSLSVNEYLNFSMDSVGQLSTSSEQGNISNKKQQYQTRNLVTLAQLLWEKPAQKSWKRQKKYIKYPENFCKLKKEKKSGREKIWE